MPWATARGFQQPLEPHASRGGRQWYLTPPEKCIYGCRCVLISRAERDAVWALSETLKLLHAVHVHVHAHMHVVDVVLLVRC
jgi:hypothetical protein